MCFFQQNLHAFRELKFTPKMLVRCFSGRFSVWIDLNAYNYFWLHIIPWSAQFWWGFPWCKSNTLAPSVNILYLMNKYFNCFIFIKYWWPVLVQEHCKHVWIDNIQDNLGRTNQFWTWSVPKWETAWESCVGCCGLYQRPMILLNLQTPLELES